MKDVARVANVSHSTVSRALHSSSLVNDETAKRIRVIARQMGYRPSAIGRSLKTRRSMTIGVVVTSVADPMLAQVVSGIEEVAIEHGYAVFLANSAADSERELKVVHSFQERRVDAIIVVSSRVGSMYMPLLDEIGVPIVLLDNQYPGDFVHTISIDDFAGAAAITEYLISLRHQRIAYLGDRFGLYSDNRRCSGYQAALRTHHIPFSAELLMQGDGSPEGGRQAMERLLALREPPTAVFCYNDLSAVGAMSAIHSKGWNIPRDISVAGFDDISTAAYLTPPLTTFRQPRRAMGRQAMQTLLDLFAGKKPATSINVRGELVVRGSTGDPPSR